MSDWQQQRLTVPVESHPDGAWLWAKPSPLDLQWARDERWRRDQADVGDVVKLAFGDGWRWAGLLGEAMLDRWVADAGLRGYRWFGGFGKDPDFLFGDLSVSVKTNNAMAQWKPHFTLRVQRNILQDGARLLVFAAYSERPNLLYLLGAIQRAAFMERALPLHDGDRLPTGTVVQGGPIFTLPTEQLVIPPARLLDILAARLPQGVAS